MSFFQNARAELFYRRAPDRREESIRLDGEGPFQGKLKGTEGFAVNWFRTGDPRALRSSLKHESGEAVRLERLELTLINQSHGAGIKLDEELPSNLAYVIYQHGYQSWSSTGMQNSRGRDTFARFAWKHDMDENPEVRGRSIFGRPLPWYSLPARGFYHSDTFLGFETIEARRAAVFFGVEGPGQQFVRFRVQLEADTDVVRELGVIWDFNGQLFDAHSIVALTPVYSVISKAKEDGSRPAMRLADLMDREMKQIAASFDTPRHAREVYAGWCSWYHYYTKIDQQIIRANLRKSVEMGLGLNVFQIDDGYQQNIGDWQPRRDRFPDGMRVLAEEIKRNRMMPGIWLAPFIARPDSELLRHYPELVLKKNGKPVNALYNPLWGGWTRCLDVTHPKFEEWIESVIFRMVAEWGYQYLKLDFLFAAAFRGDHHDPRTSGLVRVRNALKLIRKVAGKKTVLVGCGCPLLPGMGIVDIQRIGMDTNEVWNDPLIARLLRDRNFPTGRNAMQNTITRAMFHRRFWNNDPDCLLFRQDKTSLNERQIMLMASVVCLSGGMMFISDELGLVQGRGREILTRSLELFRRCAPFTSRPVGLARWRFPRALYNPGGYLGIWNPTGRPDRIRLDVSAFMDEARVRGAVNFWSGERIPWSHSEGYVELALAPYESFVCVL